VAFGSGERRRPIRGYRRVLTHRSHMNAMWPMGRRTRPGRTPARHTPGQGPWVPGAGEGEFLTVAQAAALLKVSTATVYRLVHEGEGEGDPRESCDPHSDRPSGC
jgi:hypothetical protein